MKRILILIIGLIGVAQAQYSPTSAKSRFVNGLALGTKLDSYFNAADSNAIYWRADSVVMAKYKGTARALAFAVSGGYIPYSDTTTMLRKYVNTYNDQDSIYGVKNFRNNIKSDSLANANFTIKKESNNYATVGNSSGVLKNTEIWNTNKRLPLVGDTLIMFGDSYSNSNGASTGYNGFNYLIADKYQKKYINLAQSGKGVLVAALQANTNIFPGNTNSFLTLIGFNDLYRSGYNVSTFEKIKWGNNAIMANAWIDTAFPASHARITYTPYWGSSNFSLQGGKSGGAALPGSGKYISSTGAYASFTCDNCENIAIGTLTSDSINLTGGVFDIVVDDSVYTTFNSNGKTDGIFDGGYLNQNAPAVIFLTNLSRNQHTVKIVAKNSATIYLDYIAILKPIKDMPSVFFGLLPKLDSAGYAAYGGKSSDYISSVADTYIRDGINALPGFPVSYYYTSNYYNSEGISADTVHPNDKGHRQIAQSVSEAISNVQYKVTSTSDQISITGNGVISGLSTSDSPTFNSVNIPSASSGGVDNYYKYSSTNLNPSSRKWRSGNDYTTFGDWVLQRETYQGSGVYENALRFDSSLNATFPEWVNADTLNAYGIYGNILTASQTSITSLGTLTGLTVISPINGSVTGSAATVTTAAQPAITSVGTLVSLTVTNNIQTGSINSTGNITIGGKIISNLAGGEDYSNTTAGTGARYRHDANTGADYYGGIGGSAVNSIFYNQKVYSVAVGTANNTAYEVATNNIVRTSWEGAEMVHTGNLTVSGNIIKSGGTSSQSLMADGSVQTLTSGIYLPTATNVSNTSAITIDTAQYMRVGNVVTVSGRIAFTNTLNSPSQISITLPIATVVSAVGNVAGTGNENTALKSAIIRGRTGTNDALLEVDGLNSSSYTIYYTYTYRILN